MYERLCATDLKLAVCPPSSSGNPRFDEERALRLSATQTESVSSFRPKSAANEQRRRQRRTRASATLANGPSRSLAPFRCVRRRRSSRAHSELRDSSGRVPVRVPTSREIAGPNRETRRIWRGRDGLADADVAGVSLLADASGILGHRPPRDFERPTERDRPKRGRRLAGGGTSYPESPGNEHALSRFPFRPPRIYSRRPRTSAHPPAPTLDVRSQILEQSAYLQQYHAAMAPFLGIQHPPVQSPRGNAEEEIALQALQHMKNVPPSSLAGNSNAAPGAVGTRTPQRTSATRGEGARARVPATRYRLARTRGVATRDETRAMPLASRTRASPRTHREGDSRVLFLFRADARFQSSDPPTFARRSRPRRFWSIAKNRRVLFSRIPPDRSRSLLTLETLEYPLEYPRRPPPGRSRSVQPLFGGFRPRARRARGVRQPWLALARLRQAPRVLEAQEEGGARERRRRLRHRALGDDVAGGERALRGGADA